jgi:hypothetical protein
MFELIISSVITGRVVRRTFETREEADRYADRFFDEGLRPRLRRNYRVELHTLGQPAPAAPARRPVATPTAA